MEEKVSLREEALRLKTCKFLYAEMERKFPLIHAYNQKKGCSMEILAWDQVIDWMNGGIKQRGEEFSFKIGPSFTIMERNFNIVLAMYLSQNDDDNSRACITFKLHYHDTNWKKSKEYYWQQADDIAVAYYGLQLLIHQLCEEALEKGKKQVKITPKLEKQIMEILKEANLE
jgi:hypothetical protein